MKIKKIFTMAFIKFMKNKYTRSSDHTHVMLGNPRGSYQVDGDDFEEFWKLYIDAVGQPTRPLYVAENPMDETPVMVDVDLKVDLPFEYTDHIYTEEQVLEVIAAYQVVLQKICKRLKPDSLTCVLLEKKPRVINDYVKNGFHLHFPKLFLDRKVQEMCLIPMVKKIVKNVFDNLGVKDAIN